MKVTRRPNLHCLLAILVLASFALHSALAARERQAEFVQVSVRTGRAGCAVDLDSTPVGTTNAQGTLEVLQVDPGDHYIHVQCPGEEGKAFFISPRAGEKLEIASREDEEKAPELSPLEVAKARINLHQHLQQAIQFRARGRIEEAVKHLREALKLDRQNSDLHRELGITFLLAKDWKRARVEMLEAARYNPRDADAYNGLGYALEKLGNLEAAIDAYRTASRLDPADPSYRHHYFSALAKLAEQQAEKEMKK